MLQNSPKLKKFFRVTAIILGIFIFVCLSFYTFVHVIIIEFNEGGTPSIFPYTLTFEDLCDHYEYSAEVVDVSLYNRKDEKDYKDYIRKKISEENEQLLFSAMKGQKFHRLYINPVFLNFRDSLNPTSLYDIKNDIFDFRIHDNDNSFPYMYHGNIVTHGIHRISIYKNAVTVSVQFENSSDYEIYGRFLKNDCYVVYISYDRQLLSTLKSIAENS